MQFVFLDESGSVYSSYDTFAAGYLKSLNEARTTGGRFPAYPFFILAAIGIPESHLGIVDDWFRQARTAYLGVSPGNIGREYEIKGSILYPLRLGERPAQWLGNRRKPPYAERQKKIWSSITNRSLQALEASLFQLLQRLGAPLWIVVVKQADVFGKFKNKTWHPLYWALTYLQQRVVYHVQVHHGGYQRALFVMDETSTLRTASQFDQFLSTRQTINGTASWPVDFSRYIIDVPFSGSSHLHQAIQLVDVIAYSVYRHIRREDTLGWFARIEPFLARHWTNNTYQNAGLTFIQ